QGHRAHDGEGAPQRRAREVLRRRHHAQTQASREAEGRKEADEAGRGRRDPAGGVPRRSAGRVTSSLVIQTSFLGDTVLTTPLIAELARRGPVDVVTTPASASLLANHPGIRAVVPYDKRKSDRGLLGFFRMARRLRAFHY